MQKSEKFIKILKTLAMVALKLLLRRKMIRRIQSGEEIDSWRESSEDMEILADCIVAGYVNGELKDDGKTLRTMDGKIHPIVFNSHIPLKGLAFLHPQIDWKFIIPTIISIIALLCSLLGSWSAWWLRT